MEHEEWDKYITLARPSEDIVYKEKGSKFIASAYPIIDVKEAEELILAQKKVHPKARHWCYAWQLGVQGAEFRYHDDGEPSNTAGKPIFGQIQSFGLTGVLIVVVRYFGGTKLGVGGLINAYRSAAKSCLEEAVFKEKVLLGELRLRFEYVHMEKVMRIIKERQLEIVDQQMHLACNFKVAVRMGKFEEYYRLFSELRSVRVDKLS